ncbi:MAG: hypothetical protein HC869_04810 [Rhodospirillales bacterium]|nr:hypothetical protein [Rhodospirillales bacterium]
MTSRKALATLVAAGALFTIPTASQAGGLDKMHKCMFGWMAHFHHHGAAVKGKVYKKKAVKKVKAAKAMPKK